MSGFSAGLASPNEALDSVPTEEVEASVPADPEGAVEALTGGADEGSIDSGEESTETVDPEATEDAQEAAPEAEVEQPKRKDANTRIQGLIAERDQLTERLEQREAAFARQFQAMQAQAQQQSRAQYEALQQQNQMLQEQLHMARDRYDREEYDKLPLAKQVELDAVRRSKGEIESLVNERVSSVERLLQGERAARQEAEQNWKRQQRMSALTQQVQESRGVLFKGLPEQDLGEAAEILNDMFLGYAGGKGVYPKDAAPVFRKAMETFAKAYYKNLAAQNKQQQQKSKSVPSTGNSARKPSASAQSVNMGKSLPPDGRMDMDSLFDHFASQAMSRGP